MEYKHRDYVIKQTKRSFPFYVVFKDDVPFSTLYFKRLQKATGLIDRMLLKGKKNFMPVPPMLCKCGCMQSLALVRTAKRFIEGHNNYKYYKTKKLQLCH